MDAFEKYLNLALRYLSYRPRSEKELKDYLKKKKVEPAIIDRVVKNLHEHKFLNNEEFAKWWIEQKTSFRPLGLSLIKIQLRQKGISEEVIDRLAHGSEFRVQSNLERAKMLVQKRIHRYKSRSKQEIYHKLGAFLARRGFDWDTIKQAIDDVTKKGV